MNTLSLLPKQRLRMSKLVYTFVCFLTLGALSAYSQTQYTWTNILAGDASGLWDTAVNWSPNGMPLSGDTANFSTLDITVNSTVFLNGDRTNANLIFGDTTASSDWIVDAGGVITLESLAAAPTINVTNRAATIQAPIFG